MCFRADSRSILVNKELSSPRGMRYLVREYEPLSSDTEPSFTRRRRRSRTSVTDAAEVSSEAISMNYYIIYYIELSDH